MLITLFSPISVHLYQSVSHPDVYDFSSGVATPGPTYKPRSERGYKKSIGLPAKEVAAEGPGIYTSSY